MSQAQEIAMLQVPIIASPTRPIPHRSAVPAPVLETDGLQACTRIWTRVRGLDAAFWLELPLRAPARAPGADLSGALGVGAAPYAAIALEAERTLSLGVGPASAQALLLLAAVALERDGGQRQQQQRGGEAAVQLARTACQLGARTRQAGAVYTLYAALIAPRAGELHHSVATLAGLCQDDAPAQLAALGLAGAAFAAGMPLPELVRHLDLARERPPLDEAARAAALELAGRARLLRGLLATQASVLSPSADCAGQDKRFGHWLTRLQAAWYAGDAALARQAAGRAAPLANALTPAADLMSYHLFAALASARAPAGLDGLRRHCATLNALAEHCPAAAAMAELASALIDRRAGDPVTALRGFERAAASAARRKQHWLASLAAEQAALQAADTGLATAAKHYRRQALASCVEWGALGRAEALCRAWDEPMPAPLAAPAPAPAAAPGAAPGAAPAPADCMELGASIAHEVNQPLAAIALHAAAARKWLRREQPDVERALASLSLISTAGRQAGDIVRSVRRMAARQDNEFGQVEVDAALADALMLLERPLRRHAIALDTAFGLGACAIEANRAQLQQVVTNLVVNAIEALAGAGPRFGTRRIQVSTYRYNDDMVEIAVADNGPGIAPAERERIFERLYSTKPNNTGMGLAISQAIARAHGGALAVGDCVPHGACFRLRLPLRPPVGT